MFRRRSVQNAPGAVPVVTPAGMTIGSLKVPLTHIRSINWSAEETQSSSGELLLGILYLIITVGVLVGVVEFAWASRFMAMAVIAGGIAVASLVHALRAPVLSSYRCDITLASGYTLSWSTADMTLAERVASAMQRSLSVYSLPSETMRS